MNRLRFLYPILIALFFIAAGARAEMQIRTFDVPGIADGATVEKLCISPSRSEKYSVVRTGSDNAARGLISELVYNAFGIFLGGKHGPSWVVYPVYAPQTLGQFAPKDLAISPIEHQPPATFMYTMLAISERSLRLSWELSETVNWTFIGEDGRENRAAQAKVESKTCESSYFGFPAQTVFNAVGVDPAGVFWVCTSSGILRFTYNDWSIVGGPANCVAVDAAGVKYFGTPSNGILNCRETACNTLVQPASIRGEVTAIYVSSDGGTLWFASWENSSQTVGLYRYSGGALSETLFSAGVDGWSRVPDLEADASGRLWVATDNGVKMLKDGSWSTYTVSDGLTAGKVKDVCVEKANANIGVSMEYKIWFATEQGISLISFPADSYDINALPKQTIISSSPVIDSSGVAYYGQVDGIFRALQAVDGRTIVSTPQSANLWSFQTGGPILSSPAVDYVGTILFGSNDGNLYALHPNGDLKWQYATGGAVISSPAAGQDGEVYVGSSDGYIYAIGPTGSLLWRYQTGGEVIASPALATDGTVYCGSSDGKMYALDGMGHLRWTYQTGAPVWSSAAIDLAGRIYFGSNDGKVYALEPNGSLVWSASTGGPVISSPTLDSQTGAVYVGSTDSTFYCLSIINGGKRWSFDGRAPVWGSTIMTTDGEVVCFTGHVSYIDMDLQPTTTTNQWNNLPWSYFVLTQMGVSLGGASGTGSSIACTPCATISGPVWYPNGGFSSSASPQNYDLTSWPKWRHDCRNTGNLATSLEIPMKDIDQVAIDTRCDLCRDAVLDIKDVLFLLAGGVTEPDNPLVDWNGDGVWSVSDAIVLLNDLLSGRCHPPQAILSAGGVFSPGENAYNLSQVDLIQLEGALGQMSLTASQKEQFFKELYTLANGAALPKAFKLLQNWPNPFNPSTAIKFEAPDGTVRRVTLNVFDIRGRNVKTLIDGEVDPGIHVVFWDGTDQAGRTLPSGVYFYRLNAGDFEQVRKMILLK